MTRPKPEKTSTAPKRVPKPPMNWAVDGLLRLIPFLNETSTVEKVRLAVKFVTWHDHPNAPPEFPGEHDSQDKGYSDDVFRLAPDQVEEIERAQGMVKEAVRIALHQEESNGISAKVQNWLEQALAMSVRDISWQRKHWTTMNFEFDPKLKKDPAGKSLGFCYYVGKRFKSLAAGYVCEAFNCYGRPSVGAFYVGHCPKCGKVFQKKQANAEYCSKSCMWAVFRTTKK